MPHKMNLAFEEKNLFCCNVIHKHQTTAKNSLCFNQQKILICKQKYGSLHNIYNTTCFQNKILQRQKSIIISSTLYISRTFIIPHASKIKFWRDRSLVSLAQLCIKLILLLYKMNLNSLHLQPTDLKDCICRFLLHSFI